MRKSRISKEETLSFLLTYIIVEQSRELTLNQQTLFKLTRVAQDAANQITQADGIIPHEVIEAVAQDYLTST